MRKLHFPALTPQNSEALRLTVLQSTFWASMAIGGYQTVYLQNNGFPAAQFGLLNAIACAVAIVAMTFWGMVSDRIGGQIQDAKIHTQVMGSDHCPVELDLDI